MHTKMEGTIVVGVAESVFEGQALTWAAEQALMEGRTLSLVNASGPVSGAWRENGMDAVPTSRAALRARGEELLSRARSVVEQTAPDLRIEEVFDIVDPSTLLIQLSSTAHLLVLGSRGRGPVRSHVLGSVGIAVVRHAACPVVVHHAGDQSRPDRHGIVVAAEATSDTAPVLAFAFREASLRVLPLKVVHYVYDARSAFVGTPMVGSLSEDTDERERALTELLAGHRVEHPDVDVTVQMLPGLLPEEGLAELSRDADLTVVGTHQRGFLGRILAGSVSEAVIVHAGGPVAVVPTATTQAA